MMDSPYTPLEFSLLNGWQRDFPLVSRPFAEIGRKVGAGETAILEAAIRLHRRGAISRIGAVLAPRRLGASTLAALAAPEADLESIAGQVSAFAEVNHNYRREHRLNLWFVVTTPDAARLAAVLAAIAADTGCAVLSMPLEREYHIDLGFDLGDPVASRPPPAATAGARATAGPDADDRRLLAALQGGLALVPEPFAALAAAAGMDETEVLSRLRERLADGLIKRFGVVVRHHELGYRSNAMVVFDIADDHVDAVGARLARERGVTLCYRRRRHLPEWPYNLYCMVHGRDRTRVLPVVERLGELAGTPGLALFSTQRYKQCGARYFETEPDIDDDD